MKKQILFAHSGGEQEGPGNGSHDLVEWLRKSLGEKYEISYPKIEDPEAPTYKMWEAMLETEFSKLDEESILIGHSLGGSMLLKYLSENDSDIKIGGIFLVATPWWGEQGWDMDEFKLKKDFQKLLPAISSVHFFHCMNDPIVPIEHMKLYQGILPNAVVHELNCNSHAFTDGLPELVENIKNQYPN